MFRKSLIVILALLTCFVIARGNCPNIRTVDFQNRTYPLREDGFTQRTEWLRVVNGRYEEPHENPMSLSFLYFQIVKVAFGDLSGDGKDEAAATAIYGSNSGSFFLTDTYVFRCVRARVRLIRILKQDGIEEDTGMDLQESVNNPMRITGGCLWFRMLRKGCRS